MEEVEVVWGFHILHVFHVLHGLRVSPGLTPGDILWGGRVVPAGCTDLACPVLPEFLPRSLDPWPCFKHRWQDPEVADEREDEPWPCVPGAALPLSLLLAGTSLP